MTGPTEPSDEGARTDDREDDRLMEICATLREQVVEVSRSFGEQVRHRVRGARRAPAGLGLGSLLSDVLVGISNLLVDTTHTDGDKRDEEE